MRIGRARSAGSFLLVLGVVFWEGQPAVGAVENVGIAEAISKGWGKRLGNLVLVFLRFPLPAISTAFRRFQALFRSRYRVRKSLRLASCMPFADSVSLCWPAIRSRDPMLSSGLRRACVSGALTSSRNVSHGVA